ncbi:RNA polymerase II-associated factor 1 [Wickerhamomyces ciferrii]|uniref:RNA polymerase II-associated factor 1 n=1 Tax=Wickerhamomyces ciferrii (strain ATCC 14091 / BCRC 22168 / CBS 111 / JCM 3599 / NBRC 0793 / NRRL Y-1031 F-60-10) TaxID=1206466 RepID=K0KAP1_WICCF|nr:RNA polymerase II-associated factor 1 [Wickerhamomyces ciferrii]CCH42055.1 RNA polymerase II-associated factor 1 [Wickerhamomyces ciferrii]
MSKNQDYIARIRYQNDLPAPPLPPNLLNYKISKEEDIGSSSLLSSLYRKQNVNALIKVNEDLGLPMDIIQVPEVFDPSKEDQKLHALSDNIRLHPNDRVLLRDPGVDKVIASQPNVAFLRRTEYISSTRQQGLSTAASRSATPQTQDDDNSPASQLRSIESTFTNASKTLKDITLLKHPLNKKLKAKKVWSLKPDISRLDQSFNSVRFLGSAATSNRDATNIQLRTSLLRPVELEQADWMSLYTADDEVSKGIKRKFDDLKENVPIERVDEEAERFKYTKKNDYAMKAIAMDGEIRDLAMRFDHEKNVVYFNPIQSKAELKRHRVHEALKALMDTQDFDEIHLNIREPTIKELNIRNNTRHAHDPVNYEFVQIADDEQDAEAQEQSQEPSE